MEKGLVQIYTGNGKGKTTASFGLALRALGRSKKVAIIQFLKGKESGENIFAKKNIPGLEIIKVNSLNKFFKNMDKGEIKLLKEETEKGFELVKNIIENNKCDILILDEIIPVINNQILNKEKTINLIKSKPPTMEIILTGRNAPVELVEIADLVTEMKKIKHPFDNGVQARMGIEK